MMHEGFVTREMIESKMQPGMTWAEIGMAILTELGLDPAKYGLFVKPAPSGRWEDAMIQGWEVKKIVDENGHPRSDIFPMGGQFIHGRKSR